MKTFFLMLLKSHLRGGRMLFSRPAAMAGCFGASAVCASFLSGSLQA
ncbi:hypothetical protein MR810_09555 [bacterium]|nr:hypothetical protein [bacterium]